MSTKNPDPKDVYVPTSARIKEIGGAIFTMINNKKGSKLNALNEAEIIQQNIYLLTEARKHIQDKTDLARNAKTIEYLRERLAGFEFKFIEV